MIIKRLLSFVAVAGVVSVLGACTTVYDVDASAAMDNKGDAFAKALQTRYIERARFEVGESDWQSVAFFNSRAQMAAEGKIPAPQSPSERGLKVDVDAINAAHAELTAALAGNGPKTAPDACARAQTWFEHWMEQSEEGHQPDHVAEARAGYQAAIPECKGAAAPAPMAMTPKTFIVYFDFDTASLNTAAQQKVREIADAYVKGAKVGIVGHTDTAGSAEYNRQLAEDRARQVSTALQSRGIPADHIHVDAKGKMAPAVKSGDNVKEAGNRRVEVVIMQ